MKSIKAFASFTLSKTFKRSDFVVRKNKANNDNTSVESVVVTPETRLALENCEYHYEKDIIETYVTDISADELEAFTCRIVSSILASNPIFTSLLSHETSQLLKSYLTHSIYEAVKQKLSNAADNISFDQLRSAISAFLPSQVQKLLQNRKEIINSAKPSVGHINAWSEQGLRDSNEDCHVSIPYLNQLTGLSLDIPISFFGVFDGHGGSECAKYVSSMLFVNIKNLLQQCQGIRQVLYESYMLTQEQWKRVSDKYGIPKISGATAVTAMIHGSNIYVSWVGDSSAILYLKNKVWLDFVMPHKPSLESEKSRIVKLGGFVQNDRVNGALAVSRSFGDLNIPCIIPEPDVMEYGRTGNEDFIILACDGLTDVLDPSSIQEIVMECRENGQESEISRILVEEALMRGSTDNVSVIYVNLSETQQFSEKAHIDPIAFEVNESSEKMENLSLKNLTSDTLAPRVIIEPEIGPPQNIELTVSSVDMNEFSNISNKSIVNAPVKTAFSELQALTFISEQIRMANEYAASFTTDTVLDDYVG